MFHARQCQSAEHVVQQDPALSQGKEVDRVQQLCAIHPQSHVRDHPTTINKSRTRTTVRNVCASGQSAPRHAAGQQHQLLPSVHLQDP